jgi:Protein of unknown function (DUF3037)
MSGQLHSMKYSVIRVVPDPVRDEPVNVGVALHDLADGTVMVRVTKNVQKIRTYTGEDVDVAAVAFALDALQGISPSKQADSSFLERMAGQYTQLIQFSPTSGSLAESSSEELEALYDRLVGIDRRGKRGGYIALTRKKLVGRVRRIVEARKLNVEARRRFRGILGTFVFDFVAEGDHIASLQCLSLAGDIDDATEEAKALAYSVRDVREWGRRGSERRIADLRLTSLVAPPETETEATESVRSILGDVGEVRDSERELDKALSSLVEASGS